MIQLNIKIQFHHLINALDSSIRWLLPALSTSISNFRITEPGTNPD